MLLMIVEINHSYLNGKDESHAAQQWAHNDSYHGDEESPC
jgi:hypothetical protein